MPSIYDDKTIAELRTKQCAAEDAAKQLAALAAANMRDAAAQRSRALQFAGLVAHAEDRQADQQEITRRAAQIAAHRTALQAALNLLDLDLDLPPVWMWEVRGHRDAILQIYLEGAGEDELTALETWARHLDTEVVTEVRGDRIRYEVNAEYLGASLEIYALHKAPAPEQTQTGSEAAE